MRLSLRVSVLFAGCLFVIGGCGDQATNPDVILTDIGVDAVLDTVVPEDMTVQEDRVLLDLIDVAEDQGGIEDANTGDQSQSEDTESSDSSEDVTEDAVEDASDTTVPEDTTTPEDTTEPEVVEQPSPCGRILLAAMKSGGVYNDDLQAAIDFFNGPMRMDAFAQYQPEMYEKVMSDGPCVMYMRSITTCDPDCEYEQYCDAYGQCQDSAVRLSAGDVTLMLGAASYLIEPTGTDLTYYQAPSIDASLFHSGNSIIAKADGSAEGFGTFELTTTGIDPVSFSTDDDGGTLTLLDDGENVITWTVPEGDIDGLFMDLIINTGWHGAPPGLVMYCRQAASEGSLTLPLDMVNGLPPIGGIGLFQHMSLISMNRSVSAEVEGRKIDFTVARWRRLNPMHNAW